MPANTSKTIGGFSGSGGAGGTVTEVTGGTANGVQVVVTNGTTTPNVAVKTTDTQGKVLYNGASNAFDYTAGITANDTNVLSIDVAGTANINATGTAATNIGTATAAGVTTIGNAATIAVSNSGGGSVAITGNFGVTGTTTINSISGYDTTIGTSASGQVIARGTAVQILGTTTTITGTTNLNAAGSAATNIGTSATAGTITIGASGRTITTVGTHGHTGAYNLTGTGVLTGTTTIAGTTNINTTGSSATNIGTSATAGSITIGNAGGLNTIVGPTNANGHWTINDTSGTGFTSIGTYATAGIVTIGRTGGTLNTIGTLTHTGDAAITGSLGGTSARVVKGWFTNVESTNAPTVGGSAVYYTGGTDVAVADGGTGKSSWTQYLIPYADTTTSFSQIPIGTSGQVLTSNGAGAAPSFQNASGGSGGVGSSICIEKTADETVSTSTTLQNDDEISFSIGANETWKGHMMFKLTAGASGGFKFDFTLPSGGTGNMTGVGGSAFGFSRRSVTGGHGTTVTFTNSTVYLLSFTIVNSSTAGTVQMRFAQNASDGTATTVMAGTLFHATRTA